MERGRHATDGVLEVERQLGLQVGAALGSDAGRARPRDRPRPNRLPRRSPTSSAPTSNENPPAPGRPGPPGPKPPATGPRRRTSSYSLRRASSPSTSYAAEISLKRSSALGSSWLASVVQPRQLPVRLGDVLGGRPLVHPQHRVVVLLEPLPLRSHLLTTFHESSNRVGQTGRRRRPVSEGVRVATASRRPAERPAAARIVPTGPARPETAVNPACEPSPDEAPCPSTDSRSATFQQQQARRTPRPTPARAPQLLQPNGSNGLSCRSSASNPCFCSAPINADHTGSTWSAPWANAASHVQDRQQTLDDATGGPVDLSLFWAFMRRR